MRTDYERAEVVSFVHALMICRERLEANVQARIALDALVVLAPREGRPVKT